MRLYSTNVLIKYFKSDTSTFIYNTNSLTNIVADADTDNKRCFSEQLFQEGFILFFEF